MMMIDHFRSDRRQQISALIKIRNKDIEGGEIKFGCAADYGSLYKSFWLVMKKQIIIIATTIRAKNSNNKKRSNNNKNKSNNNKNDFNLKDENIFIINYNDNDCKS
uniref:Uncharacterized protein n=1 Tax=Onchocerca volvulus TaxID=6282 RepID=A0A8R1TZ32_ONCVO